MSGRIWTLGPLHDMSVLYFLVLVGVLVAIHEFGHFLAAKLLEFKVQRFSIGFGRPLVRLRGGETEYQLGLFPLGGYVRLLGEDPGDEIAPRDAHRAWPNKPVWQRTIVVLAGPAANLLLPVVLYFAAFAGHRDLAAAVIGDVIADSPAARAGLERGDRIAAIDGDVVRYWEEVESRIRSHAGHDLRLEIERKGRSLEKHLTPIEGNRDARGGQTSGRGMVGIVAAPFLPQVGVIDPSSPAARAGLRTGDLIAAVEGAPVASWAELSQAVDGTARRLNITFLRGQRLVGVEIFEPHHTSLVSETVLAPDGARATVHGLHPADLMLAEVEANGPAARAGLRPGDLLTSVDGAAVAHWLPFEVQLAAHRTDEVRIGFLRAGSDGKVTAQQATIRQEWRRHDDDYGQSSDRLVFGARPRFVRGRAERVEIDGRFSYAAAKAVERTAETIGVVAAGMWSMMRGRSPDDELGGPITMFRVAAVSGAKGWETYLLMLALVSVSVGLINLLPVPILDGGHLLLFSIEGLRRRPLSPRSRDRITWIGLAVVGLITALALGNDFMRYVM